MSQWNIGPVGVHSQSFMNLSEVIKNEATAALWAIEKAIENGQTKEEITDEWNEVFTSDECKFNDYDEIIDYLENVGI